MTAFGLISLFGSGETSPGAHRMHRHVMAQLDRPVQCAVIETPAGFEPNSDRVARSVGEYLSQHLQEFQPEIHIIPARKRGTKHSPDDLTWVPPIFGANYLFMGPGSPTYAARQLHNSVTWYSLLAQHQRGAAIVFSSASSLAASQYVLPVYEIYKVGEDLHWKTGLDFFGAFGISLVIVPHWNNNDGGEQLDTSRCYMGEARYKELVALLDDNVTVLGIDENSGIVINPETGICEVIGIGGAVIYRNGEQKQITPNQSFSVFDLGEWRLPEKTDGIPPKVWQTMQKADAKRIEQASATPPSKVMQMVAVREVARNQNEWEEADNLRARILELGWQVNDTGEGPQLERV